MLLNPFLAGSLLAVAILFCRSGGILCSFTQFQETSDSLPRLHACSETWRTADCRARCRCVTCEDDGDSASSLHREVTHRTRNFQRGGRRQASAAMLARAACPYEEAEADPHPRPFKLQVCSVDISPRAINSRTAGATRTPRIFSSFSFSHNLAVSRSLPWPPPHPSRH